MQKSAPSISFDLEVLPNKNSTPWETVPSWNNYPSKDNSWKLAAYDNCSVKSRHPKVWEYIFSVAKGGRFSHFICGCWELILKPNLVQQLFAFYSFELAAPENFKISPGAIAEKQWQFLTWVNDSTPLLHPIEYSTFYYFQTGIDPAPPENVVIFKLWTLFIKEHRKYL